MSNPFAICVIGALISVLALVAIRAKNAGLRAEQQRVTDEQIAAQKLTIQSVKSESTPENRKNQYTLADFVDATGRVVTTRPMNGSQLKVGDSVDAYRTGSESYYIPAFDKPVPTWMTVAGVGIGVIIIAAGVMKMGGKVP